MNLHNIHLSMRISLLLIGALLIPGLLGCEKDPEPLTSNSAISGWASLYNIYTDEPTNIRVTATGPYGPKSAEVDPTGMFIIDGLGNGTYSIDYSLEGYGTLREYGIKLFGNDTVRVQGAQLFKMPSGILPSFTKAYTAIRDRYGPPTTFVCIETSLSDYSTFGLDIMIYLNVSSDVGWNNYEYFYPAWDANFNDANVHTIYIDPAVLPFESGSKVYLKGYPCNNQEYSYGYLDTYLGTRVFSTLDKSKSTTVLSFTMP
jgi:hypothetical protein